MNQTILEALARAAGLAPEKLLAVLNAGAEAVPDAADGVATLVAKISAPLSLENLAAVGAAVIGEIPNVLRGELDPRRHPADGA